MLQINLEILVNEMYFFLRTLRAITFLGEGVTQRCFEEIRLSVIVRRKEGQGTSKLSPKYSSCKRIMSKTK